MNIWVLAFIVTGGHYVSLRFIRVTSNKRKEVHLGTGEEHGKRPPDS